MNLYPQGRLSKFVRLEKLDGLVVVVPVSDWIDKKYWRQINDVLYLSGFVWAPYHRRWEQLQT